MTCYRPVTVWKPEDGPIFFSEKKDCREIEIKCGQCIGCRLEKRESWAIRCLAESKVHAENCFVTLTYSEDNYPQYGSLNYRHFQLFMKKLRNRVGPVRFFMSGEYGEELQRPHYHALFFGFNFADRVKCNSVYSSSDLYRSESLERLWPHGFSTIGEVTYASARYVAAYTVKKVTGSRAVDHYSRVVPDTGEIVQLEPEFARMSLKPGIGEKWLRQYWRDLYLTGHNAVIVDGKKKKIPRYFDAKMDEIAPLLMDEVEYDRFLRVNADDNTRARLAVREKVEYARQRFEKDKRGNLSEV